MADVQIPLDDSTLFGNDVAEDEDERVFASYVLKRREVDRFVGGDRLAITRAYKGEGKSALLRLSRSEIQKSSDPPPIIVARTASEIAPSIDSRESGTWVKAWKASILQALACELGSRLGFTWQDDEMALVEESVKHGFRQRGVISAILSRLKSPHLSAPTVNLSLPEIQSLGLTEPGPLIARWLRDRPPVWVFIDDVDQNFQNSEAHKLRIASFFIACRELASTIKEIRIRAAIRPNIWTIITLEFEALSHVEQYTNDLRWPADSFTSLIAKRVEGYLLRNGILDQALREAVRNRVSRERYFIDLVFEKDMLWGSNIRGAETLLYTLSKRRPRWMVELGKLASTRAVRRSHQRVTSEDIFSDLAAFGQRRIVDTIAEFRSQCAEVDEILSAFRQEPEEMSTEALYGVISRKVLSHVQPRITGVIGAARERDIAAFLFEIGFCYARRDLENGKYEHLTFADHPDLLRSRTGGEKGLRWEVHPVYRQHLEMRDASGKEMQRRRSGGNRARMHRGK